MRHLMTRLRVALGLLVACATVAKAQSLTKADTSAIRTLAAEQRIDTTNAQLRVIADTAWIWSRRESPGESYSIGMELHRQNGKWSVYRTSDTTAVAPSAMPVPRPPVPRDTNWVDTITVGRLPTGSCEWSKVRLRSGKPGTTTHAGTASERTCTVLAYNLTTGTAKDRPATMVFSFVEDHGPRTLPKGSVLNFADTFTVARKPDGNCAWETTPIRRGPKGSSSTMGEVRVKDCWGVVYNVTLPAELLNPRGVKADTTVLRSPR